MPICIPFYRIFVKGYFALFYWFFFTVWLYFPILSVHNTVYMDDCIFCRIARKELPAHIVFENEHVVAFLDIQPSAKGHTLVIPRAHSASILEAECDDMREVCKVVQHITPAILSSLGAQGFNLTVNTGAVAGQVIFHTHWHILPRFEGDGKKMWPHTAYAPGEIEKIAEGIRSHLG